MFAGSDRVLSVVTVINVRENCPVSGKSARSSGWQATTSGNALYRRGHDLSPACHGAPGALAAGNFRCSIDTIVAHAQWAGDPLVVPYLPHLAIGIAALVIVWPAPGSAPHPGDQATPAGPWPPAAVRRLRFWLTAAPAAPVVFGSVSLAIVVLPEEVTSARSLSAGALAGWMGWQAARARGGGIRRPRASGCA